MKKKDSATTSGGNLLRGEIETDASTWRRYAIDLIGSADKRPLSVAIEIKKGFMRVCDYISDNSKYKVKYPDQL